MKNTSTDEGNKPEKVYKYDDRDGLSDLDDLLWWEVSYYSSNDAAEVREDQAVNGF
jgi:hypothetical protein